MAQPVKSDGLFDGCYITFVTSKSLSNTLIEELSMLIKKHGGKVVEFAKDESPRDTLKSIGASRMTHVVANTIDFPQYSAMQAAMIPVVTSAWVMTSISRGKQAQLRPYSPDPRMIFSNVLITCADIPDSDKEAIIGATMALGGTQSKDLTRLTTHICALSMDHPKCQEAVKKYSKCKIVLPHWFDDCFKLGKRIDEGPYLLPDPEILKNDPESVVMIRSSQHLKGAVSATPNEPLEHLGNNPRGKLDVFANKKVMLSSDLGMSHRLRAILHGLVREGGGEPVESVDECDMFVCQYRDGDQYVRAAQAGKNVGNLAWLYHLIVQNEWTDPLRRLLHYPVPRDGIPGFKGQKIAVSNYGGEARAYLENLICATGATYTRTMKPDNTHLITARMHGEKCAAALEWKGVNTVNHLWIEESYAQCKFQSLTEKRYTHFPPLTNLGEVAGETFFDERRLRDMFYPGGEEESEGSSTTSARKKRKLLTSDVDEQERTPKVRQTALDSDASDDGSPPTVSPAKRAEEAQNNKARAYATPAKHCYVSTGKENETPSVLSTGSRSAKAQALSKLQDLAPDIALYEKEKKRTAKDGHGPWGGKRAADQIDRERAARSSSPLHERPANEEQEARRPAKKQKTSLPPVDMRVCLTGYKRWVGENQREEDADRRKLRSLGILIVTDNGPCDYLAAPRMVKTEKFLRTLARGPEIINSSFIDACLDTGERPKTEDHMLRDPEMEELYGVTIKQAVARARANKGRLLRGVAIYCTADIKNGFQSYQAIAEANGAMFKIYRARSGTTIRPTAPGEDGDTAPEPVYLLTSAHPSEKELWPRFEEMARRGNMEPRVVVSDWLLNVAMRQELWFEPKCLAAEYFKSEELG